MERSPGAAVDIDGQGWQRPDLSKFTSLTAAERRRLRAVFGHFGYGVHEELGIAGRYITLLRDPVTRVISHYFHHGRENPEELAQMSLEEFVSTRSRHLNLQTRMLTPELSSDADVSTEALALAKHRLGEFTAVGVTERFDESLLLLAQELGWSLPFYKRENDNPTPVSLNNLSHGLVAEIAERNSLDVELHRWASERFDMQVRALGLRFATRAETFGVLNRRWGQRIAARQRRVDAMRRRLQRLVAQFSD